LKNIKIKICGIKDTTILNCCNHSNVNYVGLVFYEKSPRYINIKKAKELINYKKKLEVVPVGVFVNYNFNYLSKLIKKTNLRNIQLHGNENNEYISRLKDNHKLTVIKSINISNKNDIKQIELYSCADYFLFDYKPKKNELPGGNAQSFNWSILKNFNITKPWFISGGINRNNINYIIENLIPYGIDISSGVEDQPGIKSPDKIKEIVEIING